MSYVKGFLKNPGSQKITEADKKQLKEKRIYHMQCKDLSREAPQVRLSKIPRKLTNWFPDHSKILLNTKTQYNLMNKIYLKQRQVLNPGLESFKVEGGGGGLQDLLSGSQF